jgi:hypothetical protein
MWITDRGIVCGLVNSKNRLGGFGGNIPFYYDPAQGFAVIKDDPVYPVDPELVAKGCAADVSAIGAP